MNKTTNANHPPIKDMSIDDAKAFIDAGWKTLPYMVSSREFNFLETAQGVYSGLHQVAKYHPALHEGFVQQALTFIENRPHWARTILFDVHTLARQELKVAKDVIDASLKVMADIEGLKV